MHTTTCKRAACGLAVPPYQRAKPIYLPSNATDASRGRPPAFQEVLLLISFYVSTTVISPYNKTSDVFSPEYRANTSRRIDFSADVIINTSSNIRLYTALAMHIVEIYPNIT